jgi:hypothetical protein
MSGWLLAAKLKCSISYEFDARFEVFTAVKVQVEVFWIVTP